MRFKKYELEFLNGEKVFFPLSIQQILLLLMALSFVITGVDVAIAHFQNHFIPKYELIPVFYTPIIVIACLLYLIGSRFSARVYQLSMLLGLLMGIIGTGFHLFGNITTNNNAPVTWLYVGTPLLAPIAFSGMSLYSLAIQKPDRKMLLRLVALGFFSTGLTAFLDHAQTGFESAYTLIPIVSGIFALIITWLAPGFKEEKKRANFFYATMLMMILVGIIGFLLHVSANLEGTITFSLWRLFYHTPPLAPLIFSQMGLLGILSSITSQKLDN